MTNLGFSKTLSDWLASNLKRVGTSSEEVTWVFDLEGIFEMFQSYRYFYFELLSSISFNMSDIITWLNKLSLHFKSPHILITY